VERILPLVQPRLETLGDWGRLTAPFFADEVPFDPRDLVFKGKTPEESAELLQMAIWRLERVRRFTGDGVEAALKEMAEAAGLSLRELNLPFYVALSGARVWTPLYDSMEILGSDMTRVRLRRAVDALGGLSEKRLKQLEADYARRFGA
jgi:glutamyl-tRNA synthetase